MAPEAITKTSSEQNNSINQEKQPSYTIISTATDVWSLGCILYQMIYGKAPFSHLSTVEKVKTIPDENSPILYPSNHDTDAIDSIQSCLYRRPELRATVLGEQGLIQRNYLKHSSSNENTNDLYSLRVSTKRKILTNAIGLKGIENRPNSKLRSVTYLS